MGMKGITYSGNNTIRIGWIYSGKSECFCSFLILPLFCFVFCIAVLLFFFCYLTTIFLPSSLLLFFPPLTGTRNGMEGSSRCGSSPTCLSFDISSFLHSFQPPLLEWCVLIDDALGRMVTIPLFAFRWSY
jgi:hypothetical protein